MKFRRMGSPADEVRAAPRAAQKGGTVKAAAKAIAKAAGSESTDRICATAQRAATCIRLNGGGKGG